MAKAASAGVCYLCGERLSSARMPRHLRSCATRPPKEGGNGHAGIERLLILATSGRPYWLYIEAKRTASLEDLDDLLRTTWLECCPHESAFTISGTRYARSPDEEYGTREESMEFCLGDLLQVGRGFGYEYDYGSTTELALKVVASWEGRRASRTLRVLARNDPPVVPCEECGQPAVKVCSGCDELEEGWLCRKCGRKHECGSMAFLPVVNSPRVGVCGYDGKSV